MIFGVPWAKSPLSAAPNCGGTAPPRSPPLWASGFNRSFRCLVLSPASGTPGRRRAGALTVRGVDPAGTAAGAGAAGLGAVSGVAGTLPAGITLTGNGGLAERCLGLQSVLQGARYPADYHSVKKGVQAVAGDGVPGEWVDYPYGRPLSD